jgi:hypothetical protein
MARLSSIRLTLESNLNHHSTVLLPDSMKMLMAKSTLANSDKQAERSQQVICRLQNSVKLAEYSLGNFTLT